MQHVPATTAMGFVAINMPLGGSTSDPKRYSRITDTRTQKPRHKIRKVS